MTMQKKIFRNFTVISLIAVMIAMVLSLGGCSGGSSVEGRGEMVSRDFNVTNFNAINFSGPYNVTWQQGPAISVTAVMQENLFNYFNVLVSNSVLRADFSRSITVRGNNTPRIYITAPYLESAHFHGATNATDWDTIYAEAFYLNTSGAGNITLNLEVDNLILFASGTSDITISGNANVTDVVVMGTGSISAENLQIRDARVNISGVGNADINVSDYLDVTLSGVGNIRYRGDPTVTQNVSGLGSVRRMD